MKNLNISKLNIPLLLIILFLCFGCCPKVQVDTTSATPTFPSPSKETLMKIKGLNDPNVDQWMVQLFKLKLELNELNK